MIQADALIGGFRKSLAEQWGYIYGETHTMWSEAKQKAYAERIKQLRKEARRTK